MPFHYYGIWDENVNYQAIPWRNGRFDPSALENKFATQKRADHALLQWQQYKQQIQARGSWGANNPVS